MAGYISVIRQAFQFFPLIAIVLTFPYIIYNYHKYGSVMSFRILIVFSFILYLLTVIFLTQFPLPDYNQVAVMTGPRIQLDPLQFIQDIRSTLDLSLRHPSTWRPLLHNKAFQEFVFNIAMCVPFGMYMKYYFHLGFWKTLILTFLFSLFIETTQLTGLWFLYPRSYRLFDVDDLLANTMGGLIGWILMVPFSALLPSRERIDQAARRRGTKVSFLRRVCAAVIDILLSGMIAIFIGFFQPAVMDHIELSILATVILMSALSVFLLKGSTPGIAMTSMRVVDKEGKTPGILILLIRFALEYGAVLGLPMASGLPQIASGSQDRTGFALILLFVIILFVSFVMSVTKRVSLFGWLTGTKVVSTIRPVRSSKQKAEK